MNTEQLDQVRDNFRHLAPRGPELFEKFVKRVRAANPTLGKLFPDSPRDHAQPYLAPCGMVVKNMHRLAAIEYLLREMGARNQMLGVEPQHYGIIRDAMLETLREGMGSDWTHELHDDWTDAIQIVTSIMIRGAGRARAKAA